MKGVIDRLAAVEVSTEIWDLDGCTQLVSIDRQDKDAILRALRAGRAVVDELGGDKEWMTEAEAALVEAFKEDDDE